MGAPLLGFEGGAFSFEFIKVPVFLAYPPELHYEDISRVENGHTVPAIETLEKMAYQLFYDGEEPPALPNLPKRKSSDDIAWGSSGKDARYLNKLRRLLAKAEEGNRKLILYMAQKMAGTKSRRPPASN